ncbi:ZmpA/ZmpB/ZmpC family metallo-endopeptidase, partial [Streptococcus suis]
DSVFVAYNVPLLDGTWRGPSLYSHEMTHANDEKALFGGVYGQHGRRKGQGAEVYARGLFEAKDNTVLANGTLTPSFNLNTTLDIPEAKAGDIKMQFSTPAATVTALEQDGRRIMDLVQWMEAREAKVAL